MEGTSRGNGRTRSAGVSTGADDGCRSASKRRAESWTQEKGKHGAAETQRFSQPGRFRRKTCRSACADLDEILDLVLVLGAVVLHPALELRTVCVRVQCVRLRMWTWAAGAQCETRGTAHTRATCAAISDCTGAKAAMMTLVLSLPVMMLCMCTSI